MDGILRSIIICTTRIYGTTLLGFIYQGVEGFELLLLADGRTSRQDEVTKVWGWVRDDNVKLVMLCGNVRILMSGHGRIYIVSILSLGDVIIEVVGERERVDDAIGLIASDLRGFTVYDDMMLNLREQGGIPTPYSVEYANECSSGKDQCKSSNLDVQEPAFEDPYEYFDRGGKFKVLKSMTCETANLTPKNVVSEIVGDAKKYDKFKDLKTQRSCELRHCKTIPLFVARCIMGLNGENINTIQQSCLASIILEPDPRNEMIIRIRGGSEYEVEVAKFLMEGSFFLLWTICLRVSGSFPPLVEKRNGFDESGVNCFTVMVL